MVYDTLYYQKWNSKFTSVHFHTVTLYDYRTTMTNRWILTGPSGWSLSLATHPRPREYGEMPLNNTHSSGKSLAALASPHTQALWGLCGIPGMLGKSNACTNSGYLALFSPPTKSLDIMVSKIYAENKMSIASMSHSLIHTHTNLSQL